MPQLSGQAPGWMISCVVGSYHGLIHVDVQHKYLVVSHTVAYQHSAYVHDSYSRDAQMASMSHDPQKISWNPKTSEQVMLAL
jgi:hypothetical protein